MRDAVRDATLSDLPALLAMGEKFVDLAWSRVNIPFDKETCTELLTNLIEGADNILLVDDDVQAMFGAAIHGWHFNKHKINGTELFWWRERGSRAANAVKAAGEQRARELGADTFCMALQAHMRSDALDRLYRMQGYVPSEVIYIKEIG